jgi:diacylglycerol kinase (ATP)
MGVRKFLDSFNYAVAGVVHTLRTQRNMRIHFTAAVLALGLGLYLHVSSGDLLFLFFAITLVIMAEMFNTAVETVVNLCVQEYHPLARIAKDVAAGAVIIAALNSLVVAYIVFYPRLEGLPFYSGTRMKEAPLFVTLVALSMVMILVAAGKAWSGKGIFVKGGLPSGHTALAFGGATALALLTGNPLVATVALIMALLVAHSRLDSGVHTFFEVVAGALLGIVATFTVFLLAGW